jgi:hypothetical protein
VRVCVFYFFYVERVRYRERQRESVCGDNILTSPITLLWHFVLRETTNVYAMEVREDSEDRYSVHSNGRSGLLQQYNKIQFNRERRRVRWIIF